MTNDPVVITIYGPISKITGDYPRAAIRELTSYAVEGAQFSMPFKKGIWDGRKHLFKANTATFPTGLLDLVTHACDVVQVPYTVNDLRPVLTPKGGTFDLVGVKMEGKYSYQLDACKTAVDKKQGIIKVSTGGGKTNIAAAITQYLKLSTLFLVTSKELLYQAQERFIKYLGVTSDEVGIIGDGAWAPGSWVTIAIVDTLESRLDKDECQTFLKSIEVLFSDEAHHMGSDTLYEVCLLCNAYYRYALSGTPLDRTDGANLRLLAAIGPVIVDISNKTLVDLGITARANIIFSKISTPVLKKTLTYPSAYKQGVVDNDVLLQDIVSWTRFFCKEGLSTLILVEEINHGKRVDEALWTSTNGEFIPHLFIHGDEDTDARRNALKDFGEKRLPVLISSRILDEGVDCPAIDALILAGSRKSKIKTLQRLGRGLRGDKLIAVEFANFTHDYLLQHSLQRYEDYKKEDCFTLLQSGPDQILIHKLWNDK